MTTEAKPSDLTARFRRATAAPTVAEAATAPIEGEQVALELPIPKQRRVRFTLDMAYRQHRFLKYFALDQDVDASEVMRGLLSILEEDPRVARDLKVRLEAAKQ